MKKGRQLRKFDGGYCSQVTWLYGMWLVVGQERDFAPLAIEAEPGHLAKAAVELLALYHEDKIALVIIVAIPV